MTILLVDGREVRTNWEKGRSSYPIANGEERKGWSIKVKKDCFERDEDFVKRLGTYYSRVSLYESTTRVKGLHETFAYVK